MDVDEQSNVTKLASSAPTTGLGLEINPIMKDIQENCVSWINSLTLHAAHRYRSRATPTLCGPRRRVDLPCVVEVLSLPDFGELYTMRRIVVIGIHDATIMRTLLGEPAGTSPSLQV